MNIWLTHRNRWQAVLLKMIGVNTGGCFSG
jgi:hypothetical protein